MAHDISDIRFNFIRAIEDGHFSEVYEILHSEDIDAIFDGHSYIPFEIYSPDLAVLDLLLTHRIKQGEFGLFEVSGMWCSDLGEDMELTS